MDESIRKHIEKYYGKARLLCTDRSDPRHPFALYLIEPRPHHNYYTLMTVGASRYESHYEEDGQRLTCYQEFMVNLPVSWNGKAEDFRNPDWNWPLRLLSVITSFTIGRKSAWQWGQTVGLPARSSIFDNTNFVGAVLLSPGVFGEGSFTCQDEQNHTVEFFQVIPLYPEEINKVMLDGAESFLDLCSDDVLEVIHVDRPNAVTEPEKVNYDSALLDEASRHIRLMQSLGIQTDPLAPFNHMAIYLRWAILRGRLSHPFLLAQRDLIQKVRNQPDFDLRRVLRDDVYFGQALRTTYLDRFGTSFSNDYNSNNRRTPYEYLDDVHAYAKEFFGDAFAATPEQEKALYLLVPWSVAYVHAITKKIDRRYQRWLGNDRDALPENTDWMQDPASFLSQWDRPIDCLITKKVWERNYPIRVAIRNEVSRDRKGWNTGWVFCYNDDEDDDEGGFVYVTVDQVYALDSSIARLWEQPSKTMYVKTEENHWIEQVERDGSVFRVPEDCVLS